VELKISLGSLLNFAIRQSLLGIVNILRTVRARDVTEIERSVTFPPYTYL